MRGLDQILGFFDRNFAFFGEELTSHIGVTCGCVDASANRGGAEVDFFDQRSGLAQTHHVFLQHDSIRRKLLPQGHRHSILQLRATNLKNAFELLSLGFKAALQNLHRGEQAVNARPQRNAHGGGIHIIRALRSVHMVIRMQDVIAAFFKAKLFKRDIGNHLVGVHVGRRARTALDHIHHELLFVIASNQFIAGQDHSGGALAI